ncbi:hypothetical protein Acr_00g0004260 [Actinidia rufa]|uniref:Uncharacterized protein n=1 Tax=Actinidia rufa TaxID=165716 RepID=A0A7J0D7D4_9ERIC|nr:hypothetical protein Acr_00g0004260 [Actinidia rufa]
MALSDMWVGVESPFERSLGSPLPGHQKPESSGTRARKKPSSLTLFSLLIAVGGSHSRDGVWESMFERDSFYLSDSLLTLIAGSGRKPIKELDFWFENQEEKELLHMARSIPYHNTRRLAVPKEEGKGDTYHRAFHFFIKGLTGSITGLTLLALWDPIPTPDMASWGTSYKKGRSAKWIAKGKFLLRTSSMTKQKYSGLVNKNQFLLLHGVHYHSK